MKLVRKSGYELEEGEYRDGSTAVRVYTEDGLPYAMLSIYHPEVSPYLKKGEFILNHDLNHRMFEEFRETMLSNWCEYTGKTCNYGFVKGQDIWRLKPLP